MKLLRPLFVLVCLFLLAAASLWWNQPATVDMANYAPADSLAYIEINSVPEITSAIQQTDTWKEISATVGISNKPEARWAVFASRTGLAPVDAVIFTRAQMALVVLGINTVEKDDSLRVKPEVALIVETHTSKWRMKSAAIANIKRLSTFAYGDSVCTEHTADADYIECAAPNGSRKIVGAIDGSVVIIGNSDKAVATCLEVRHGQRPNLRTDSELASLRTSLKAESALAFGYVSQANAAKLFSVGVPVLLGKTPGDHQLEQLLATSAAKILRGVAWTSASFAGGIEDRYQISLDPEVIKRLEPAFETTIGEEDYWKLVPDSFRSLTVYRTKDPQAAWSSLDSALAMKLDAVSTILFASILKSGLSGYGIEDPRPVLASLTPPLITVRPTLGEGSLLLARVKNEDQLRQALATSLSKEEPHQILHGIESDPDKNKVFTIVFVDGFVVMGKTENILVYLAQLRNKEVVTSAHLETLKLSNRHDSSAAITYTNERASLATIIGALSLLKGRALSENELALLQNRLERINDSCTESNLNSQGIERRTQSAFGQFGTLLSLAQADSSNAIAR